VDITGSLGIRFTAGGPRIVRTAAGRDADRFIAIRAAILPIPQAMQKAENYDGRVQDLLSSGA